MNYILIGIAAIIIIYIIVIYNGLISKKNQVDRAWSDIDTHL